ncbi:right-handed parallel beta-helix repeat-containing protein [Dysgonomonas reticulitermitis]
MKVKNSILLLFLFVMAISCTKTETIINAGDFIKGKDATPGIFAAIKECKKVKAKKLIFPKGKYEFWPDYATEKYLFISNNDGSLKRFAFDLTGMKDFEIDGQGSEFIFHGFISPFLLENAKNINFKNFSIDYHRTFHSEGKIVAVADDCVDVYFSDSFPYKVENNVLIFTDDEKRIYPWNSLLEFDPEKKETAYKVVDYWSGPYTKVEELEKGYVRVHHPGLKATKGNVMTFAAAHRLVPAFNITKSENINFSHINMYHCGGMGIIAQLSKNINVDSVKVCPTPNSGRVVSLTADATHFVNCSGYINLTNCLFESQKDDATNIHGLYAQIDQILSGKELMVRMVHPQQYGVDFVLPEGNMEFVESESLNTYADNIVLKTERINEEYTKVTFKNTLSDKIKEGDGIATIDTQPEVLIKNCIIRGNRARGILLGSRGKTIIEDNYFHTPGAAILLEGDCRFWYEQAGVRDLIVRNNTFDNCFYGTWGNAVIQVASGISEDKKTESDYNRNILIENNKFNIFTPEILNLYSVDGVVFKNNTINKTTDYPCSDTKAESFVIEHSRDVKVESDTQNLF